ncbi:IS200/IS605 family transposase [Nonomuraea sp. B12E4]|uniref:IS200/IS605 family transposase n=1 Tax=Nonomuraea sp. B12E4 TaxID=3153564 RepID=UPI00325E5A0F
MAGHEGIRTGRHCVSALHAHLVFVTRFRHKVFTDTHLNRMEEIMRDVCADFETEPREFNGENNSRPPAGELSPKIAPSTLVNSLKGVSSRRMRQEFPEPARHYYRAEQAVAGLLLHRAGGRRTAQRPAPVHRAAKPSRSGHAQAPEGLPAWASTPGLKAGALAHILVADTAVAAAHVDVLPAARCGLGDSAAAAYLMR